MVVRIITDTSRAQGLDQTSDRAGKFSRGLAAASKVAAGALVVVGAAAVKAGQAAAEDAKSQALLANSMRNSAGATSAQIAATEDMIAKMSLATGVADDELRPAMATLVRATGDTAKSQEALAVAMDVAAATGKPLKSVSEAMAKGFAGTTTSLGRLVPGISKAALESGDMAVIMDELAKKTGGAAAEAADTAQGKMDRMTVAMNEAQESIGSALLPAMGKLAGGLATVATFAAKHPALFQAIAAVVVVLAVGILTLTAAVKAYTLATQVAGIVSRVAWLSALGPILLVVAAVALVVGAIILLWKKSQTFRAIVLAVWRAIKAGASAVGRAIKAAWLAMLRAIAAALKKVASVARTVWGAIKAAASAVAATVRNVWNVLAGRLRTIFTSIRDTARNAWQAIRDKVGTVVEGIRTVWRNLVDAIKGALGGNVGKALAAPFEGMKLAVDAVRTAVNAVINAVESLIGWVSRIDFPNIPNLNPFSRAAAAPSLAPVVGTRGGLLAPAVPSRAALGASAGGTTIIVNGALDPEAVARQIQRILAGHDRRVRGRAS